MEERDGRAEPAAEAVGLRQLEEIVVGAAHELNNPLTSIQGLAGLVAQETDDEALSEDLTLIAREAERAVRILRNLREFVGPIHREQPQELDLASLLVLTCRTREYEIKARGIELEVQVDDELPPARGNRRLLCHLLAGLLLRAERRVVRAMQDDAAGVSPDPFIRIGVTRAEGGIHLTVQDSGGPHDSLDRLQTVAGAVGTSLRTEALPAGETAVVAEIPGDATRDGSGSR